jgi:probable F420-dependent oxidoreductase
MSRPRKFRFAAQVAKAASAKEWADIARKAEEVGYSTLFMPDHFDDQLAPVPALATAAAATSTLRVGALVFDNDYKHPLVLAKEAATIDLLSDGRLEFGLGAGWMRTDYEQSGIAYDPPKVRVDRFEEGLQVVKGLLSGEPFSFEGTYYKIANHTGSPRPVQEPHPPILIGGGGKRMLSIAAREADIVGINANLRTGQVDAEVARSITPAETTKKIEWVREAAGDRFDQIELNTLVGFAMVTDDAPSLAEAMAPNFGLDPAEALQVPFVLAGTIDEMCEELQRRRELWGLTYISFGGGSWEAMAPVVSRLAGT